MSNTYKAINKGEEQYFEQVNFWSANDKKPDLLNIGSKLPEGTEVKEEDLEIGWELFSDEEGWRNVSNTTVKSLSGIPLVENILRQVATLKAKAELTESPEEQISERDYATMPVDELLSREEVVNAPEVDQGVVLFRGLDIYEQAKQDDLILDIIRMIRYNPSMREEELINHVSDRYFIKESSSVSPLKDREQEEESHLVDKPEIQDNSVKFTAFILDTEETIDINNYDGDEYLFRIGKSGIEVDYLEEVHYEGGGEIHTRYEWKHVPAKVYINHRQEPELYGYVFEGKFYKSLDELKGQTFFEGNEPVAVYRK